jgi:chemotaxis protein methyltransferase CheR
MAFTFFFRDITSIEEAVQQILPTIIGRSKINIWDAGCAMGPEPYTLAIVLAENLGQFAFKNVKIYATDHDESGHFGEIIAEGIYSFDELKRMPDDMFQKYFTPTDKDGYFQISQILRNAVIFQKHDLLQLQAIRNDFILIMCKNVLLHFQQVDRVKVMRMFHTALQSDGIFVTENTQKMPEELEHLYVKTGKGSQTFQKR